MKIFFTLSKEQRTGNDSYVETIISIGNFLRQLSATHIDQEILVRTQILTGEISLSCFSLRDYFGLDLGAASRPFRERDNQLLTEAAIISMHCQCPRMGIFCAGRVCYYLAL